MPWRTFLARTLVAGVVVCGAAFIGVKLASADPGGPASPDALTFAGVLRTSTGGPFVGTTTLTFVFHKGGLTASACSSDPSAMVTIPASANGAFTVQIPMDPTRCPRSLFDGSTVTYDVLQSGESAPIATGISVTPVPYARFADQAGVNNDCPAGYERGALTTDTPGIVCVRNVVLGTVTVRDEVVKVGSGASAFWVDRYEAGVFHRTTGAQLGALSMTGTPPDNIESVGLSRSGQHAPGAAPVLAISRVGFPTVNVTWFQANEACRASGKRLLTRSEWFAAAGGTPDSSALCNTGTSAPATPLPTGACASSVGALGMIGNVSEWTDEWYANAGTVSSIVNDPTPTSPWPAGYGDGQDRTWNVGSYVERGGGVVTGMPAAAIRGGTWGNGDSGGVFALSLDFGPSVWRDYLGFRCAIQR